jgi:hypothetical protein
MKVTQTPESTTQKPLITTCDTNTQAFHCPLCNSMMDVACNPDETKKGTYYEVLGNYCIVCNVYSMLSHQTQSPTQFYTQFITDFTQEGCRIVGMPVFQDYAEFQQLYPSTTFRIACLCPDDDCPEKDPKTIMEFLQKKDPNNTQ